MNGAPAGDLIATVRIERHEFFERDGDHLHTRANITVTQAALGAQITVVGIMPDEEVPVKIPAGCQCGRKFRLSGRGKSSSMHPNLRGDLYVVIQITVPTDLSRAEVRKLKEYEQLRKNKGGGSSAA